ncbi:MAG TPA: response regulator transcription factor [Nitrospiria bacterium]|nr:response regulator transcription factor [Nitrospiria bacterium]
MSAPLLILIVEDDPKTSNLLKVYLEREGYATRTAADGAQAVDIAQRHRPALIVLDLMIPKLDGLEVCRRIRQTSDTPVLMLTARVEEVDKLVGLSIGADDYVTKPFSPREVVARVKAILRRASPKPDGTAVTILASGDLVVDEAKAKVTLKGKPVSLTAIELRLLTKLMRSPGTVFSRAQLLDALYTQDTVHVLDRTVDVHIGRLRDKIEPAPSQPCYVLTVRGLGYKFRDQDRT